MQMFDLPLRGLVKELQVPSNVRNFWSPEQSGLGLQTSLKKFCNTKFFLFIFTPAPFLLADFSLFGRCSSAPGLQSESPAVQLDAQTSCKWESDSLTWCLSSPSCAGRAGREVLVLFLVGLKLSHQLCLAFVRI